MQNSRLLAGAREQQAAEHNYTLRWESDGSTSTIYAHQVADSLRGAAEFVERPAESLLYEEGERVKANWGGSWDHARPAKTLAFASRSVWRALLMCTHS